MCAHQDARSGSGNGGLLRGLSGDGRTTRGHGTTRTAEEPILDPQQETLRATRNIQADNITVPEQLPPRATATSTPTQRPLTVYISKERAQAARRTSGVAAGHRLHPVHEARRTLRNESQDGNKLQNQAGSGTRLETRATTSTNGIGSCIVQGTYGLLEPGAGIAGEAQEGRGAGVAGRGWVAVPTLEPDPQAFRGRTLWDTMQVLQNNAVFQLISTTYKAEGLGRSPMEQQIRDLMYGQQ